MRRTLVLSAGIALVLATALAVHFGSGREPDAPSAAGAALAGASEADIEARGAYLARIGNCAGCHTARGGEPFAGGLRLESDFGTFRTPNITPDAGTGIGEWSRSDFRRALRHGERPDGSKLYPACPYPSFTHVRPADIDAIHAFLQTVPAVERRNRGHALRFPYGHRPLLSIWQALYFDPRPLAAEPNADAEWRRGRYLVEGLGHCNDCHRARGSFGAVHNAADAPGGRVHGWYAPSLASRHEAGLQAWSVEAGARLLRSGKAEGAVMMGPMAGVVFESLQHLTEADARAMATYLRALPEREIDTSGHRMRLSPRARESALRRGHTVYARHCEDCHGAAGEGTAGVTALAGNRAVLMNDATNVINLIRQGGFPASTPGHPRPHGMPPFANMSQSDLAAVATFIRRSWANDAPGVSTIDIAD